MDIILFGIQGSGKGTQGKVLAEKYNLKSFDMGGQLREMISSGSDLGMKLKGIVEAGNLVDDDTVIEVIESFLSTATSDQSILFDGIPRTLKQSEKLLNLLESNNRDAFAVLVKISEKEALRRTTQRRLCEKCKGIYGPDYKSDECHHCGGKLITRSDDNLESIQRRIDTYNTETVPVIKDFYDRDHLIEVDGEQAINDVSAEMIEKVDYLFG